MFTGAWWTGNYAEKNDNQIKSNSAWLGVGASSVIQACTLGFCMGLVMLMRGIANSTGRSQEDVAIVLGTVNTVFYAMGPVLWFVYYLDYKCGIPCVGKNAGQVHNLFHPAASSAGILLWGLGFLLAILYDNNYEQVFGLFAGLGAVGAGLNYWSAVAAMFSLKETFNHDWQRTLAFVIAACLQGFYVAMLPVFYDQVEVTYVPSAKMYDSQIPMHMFYLLALTIGANFVLAHATVNVSFASKANDVLAASGGNATSAAQPQSTAGLFGPYRKLVNQARASGKSVTKSVGSYFLAMMLSFVSFTAADYVPHLWMRPYMTNSTSYNNTVLSQSTFSDVDNDQISYWYAWGAIILLVPVGFVLVVTATKDYSMIVSNIIHGLVVVGALIMLLIWLTGTFKTYTDFRMVAGFYGGFRAGAVLLYCIDICMVQTSFDTDANVANMYNMNAIAILSLAGALGNMIGLVVTRQVYKLTELQEPLRFSSGMMGAALGLLFISWMIVWYSDIKKKLTAKTTFTDYKVLQDESRASSVSARSLTMTGV